MRSYDSQAKAPIHMEVCLSVYLFICLLVLFRSVFFAHTFPDTFCRLDLRRSYACFIDKTLTDNLRGR